MKHIGHVSQFPQLAAIVNAIFVSGPAEPNKNHSFDWKNKHIQVGFFQHKRLWYARLGRNTYVEQNPKSHSPHAARARLGAKIIWVIRASANKGGQDEFIGRIENGHVFMKERQERA